MRPGSRPVRVIATVSRGSPASASVRRLKLIVAPRALAVMQEAEMHGLLTISWV